MKEQQNYYDIFEGEDEYTLIFGPPETIDQDVDWVDQVLDEDDGTTSPFLDFAEQTEIEGLNGDDTIYGSEDGYNFIYGHGGDDVIFGGDGHYNRLFGGDGDDTFYVGTGQRNVARGGTATAPSISVGGTYTATTEMTLSIRKAEPRLAATGTTFSSVRMGP